MAKSTYFHDEPIYIAIGIDADLCLMATIEFTCTPHIPASFDAPEEGGEVEIIKITELYRPAKKSGSSRVSFDCPSWLADWIAENVDTGNLVNSVERDR